MQYKLFSFDVETYGLDVYHRRIGIYSFSIGWVDKNYKIQTRVYKYNKQGREILLKFFANPYYIKIAHNFKYELSILETNNIPYHPNTKWHDTMIEYRMIFNTHMKSSLDKIGYEFFGITREYDKKFKKYMDKGYTVNQIPAKFLHKYQTLDAIRPLLIHYLLFPKIVKNEQLCKLYYEEVENIKCTQKEEETGIHLHHENMKKMKHVLTKSLKNLKQYYREGLNLDSPTQLRQLLYEECKLKPIRYTETGHPSTDKHTILQMIENNPNSVLMGIIKNRSYSAALGNIEKWLELQDSQGRIHADIRTNSARTGRRSCSNPNLQNINKGKTLLNIFPVPLRKCFRPPNDCVLFPVDYSQIELRLIIDAAGEYEILDLLQKHPETDLHHFTVECFSMDQIFENPGDKIFQQGIDSAARLKKTDEKQYKMMRGAYKNTGFAIGYGANIQKVSQILKKTTQEIYIGDTNFRKRFPKIASFSRDTIQEVRDTAGVTTSFGRFLYVNPSRAFAGANYKIQGTAASVLKIGQNNCFKFLNEHKLHRWITICLDIHDECIFCCSNHLRQSKEFKIVINRLTKCMTTIPHIKIPLKVEWSICENNWHDKKDLVI